jgi:hypothetical protein
MERPARGWFRFGEFTFDPPLEIQLGLIGVRIDGVEWSFVWDGMAPGKYMLRFPPGAVEHCWAGTKRGKDPFAIVNDKHGYILCVVDE